MGFKAFSHMLFPWLVDLVRKGHPNQATSFVTRFVGPCIFCKCLRYLSWERKEVTSSFTLPVSQTCLAVSTLSDLQAGRTASPSVSCEKPPVPSVPGLLSAVICAPAAELVPSAVSRRYKASAPGVTEVPRAADAPWPTTLLYTPPLEIP